MHLRFGSWVKRVAVVLNMSVYYPPNLVFLFYLSVVLFTLSVMASSEADSVYQRSVVWENFLDMACFLEHGQSLLLLWAAQTMVINRVWDTVLERQPRFDYSMWRKLLFNRYIMWCQTLNFLHWAHTCFSTLTWTCVYTSYSQVLIKTQFQINTYYFAFLTVFFLFSVFQFASFYAAIFVRPLIFFTSAINSIPITSTRLLSPQSPLLASNFTFSHSLLPPFPISITVSNRIFMSNDVQLATSTVGCTLVVLKSDYRLQAVLCYTRRDFGRRGEQ